MSPEYCPECRLDIFLDDRDLHILTLKMDFALDAARAAIKDKSLTNKDRLALTKERVIRYELLKRRFLMRIGTE